MKATAPTHQGGHLISVTSRVIAGVAGGYAFVSLLTVAASLALPLIGISQAEAMLAMTMASFILYGCIILAVFHARSALRAWAGLFIAALPVALIIVVLHEGF